jgi:hypothetical protein
MYELNVGVMNIDLLLNINSIIDLKFVCRDGALQIKMIL